MLKSVPDRNVCTVAACFTVLAGILLQGVPAAANEASIRADLQHSASAVPGAAVSLGPATSEEQSWGYSGPMLRATMTLPLGFPLSGILAEAGSIYTTTTASIPIWDVAVMEAAKHEVAAGGDVEGVVIARGYDDSPAEPTTELLVEFGGYESPPESSAAMPTEELTLAVRGALPLWAAGGSVDVIEDAAEERVVSLELSTAPEAFRFIDPDDALLSMLESQQELAPDGANIGRVTAKISDLLTGNPLYTAAGDAYLGFVAVWSSPLIQGLMGIRQAHAGDVKELVPPP